MAEQRRTTTIRELLNRLFPNQDAEVDVTDLQALELNNVVNLNESTNTESTLQVPVEEDKKEDKKMVIPKYDVNTGLFDLNGIEDVELRAELKLANDTVKANRNKEIINTAINERLKTANKIDGITDAVITSLIDRSNIKVVDGVAQGVNEAFDKLISEQKGLFKEVAKTDVKQSKTTVSSPLTEGFAPVNNNRTSGKLSFVEAVASKSN